MIAQIALIPAVVATILISRNPDTTKRIFPVALLATSAFIIGYEVSPQTAPVSPQAKAVSAPRETTRIVHVRKVVDTIPRYITPSPALEAGRRSCGGEPVRILNVSTDKSEGRTRTWTQVQPVGKDYSVMCRTNGDYSENWKPGMVVRLYASTLDVHDD